MPPRPRIPGQPDQAPVPGQQQAASPPQLPGPTFAIAPALANNGIIDFASPSGAKLFKAGTDALSSTFDCTAVNLQLFLDQLRDKVAIHDWNDIINIPDIGPGHETKSLIDFYGELSFEKVKEHAETYVNTNTRNAQDSFMLYNCIMNTLTNEAQKQVRNRGLVTSFYLQGRGSGALLLKVVIMVSHVDTRATVTAVRTKLSSLDSAMREHDSDIQNFNNHVLSLISQLHARGEQTQDLLVNLLKGYKACKDAEFVDYIKKKEDIYEEGGQVDYSQLMDWAINKFKSRKEAGTWCKKTTEEESIIALQAQIKHLVRTSNKEQEPRGKAKIKAKDQRNIDPWMKEPPKEGQKKTKTVNNRVFHWCQHHNLWTRHKPSECQKGNTKPNPSKDEGIKSKADNGPSISKALEAVASAASDDEE